MAQGAKKPGGRRRKHSMQGRSREAQGCRDAGSSLEAKQDAFLKRYIAKSHLPHLMAQRTSASNSASHSRSEPSSTTPAPSISFHTAFFWLSRTLAALPSLFPGADTRKHCSSCTSPQGSADHCWDIPYSNDLSRHPTPAHQPPCPHPVGSPDPWCCSSQQLPHTSTIPLLHLSSPEPLQHHHFLEFST